MILIMNDCITIADLQDKFHNCFPLFKIEFFKGQHALKANKPATGNLTIGDISKKHHSGAIVIKSKDTAEKVVHEFKMQFGLLVQLYQLHNGQYTPMQEHQQLCEEMIPLTNSQATTNEKTQYDEGEEEVILSV